MTTDTVTNGSDDADTVGSLRYELAHATPGDTINFAPGVTSVTLSSTLTITQDVTIEGGSAANVDIVGGGSSGGFSDFTIVKGVDATFDHLTISGGAFVGQDATLAAASPTQGGSGGGAANVFGELHLVNSTISGNTAVGGAGSDAYRTDNFYKGGGAGGTAVGGIYVGYGGRLDLYGRSDTFAKNRATGGHGGAGGQSTYAKGGAGGAGAHAVTRYAHGHSIFHRGTHGRRGMTSALAEGRSGAGAGGRGGANGQNGRTYRVASYYAPYVGIGSGGGGGGGNAFSDFGGKGVIARFRAPQKVAAAEKPTTHAAFVQATSTAPCFVAGTRIATARGPVRVEDLAVGDLVATTSGAHRPIRWLGHRTIDCRRHPRPHEARPIEIAAHAFGEGRPARDLRVSPGHSICVDIVGEVLIPAASLVNGATIRQVEVDEVTYWHVELDSHDVLLAENLPAESYLDMGNRGFFHEADVVDLAAGPDGDPALRTHADFCRPFHDAGALVEVVKAQLAARAESMGWSLTRALELHLEVDGRRLEPVVRGATVRFHVPAGAREVWLVAPTARPRDTMLTGDDRDLGLFLAALRIDDGITAPRDIALDDPRLCVGFHALEDGRRWTAGRALLPAAFWDGCEGGFFLRLQLAAGPVSRWERARGDDRRHIAVA